jgi:hypothetical protein
MKLLALLLAVFMFSLTARAQSASGLNERHFLVMALSKNCSLSCYSVNECAEGYVDTAQSALNAICPGVGAENALLDYGVYLKTYLNKDLRNYNIANLEKLSLKQILIETSK